MGIPFYHTYQSQKGGIKEKMNTLRKMRKNAKALSPVVASIILIAVTVAVSIAVAAWMGALVVGNMNTEEVKITNVEFTTTGVQLTAKNTGSTAVIISQVLYGNGTAPDTYVLNPADGKIDANAQLTATITAPYVAGQSYQFKLVSSKGNSFVYTATAPL